VAESDHPLHVHLPDAHRTLIVMIVIMETFALVRTTPSGVANMAHLGGLLYGYLFLRYNERVAEWFHGRGGAQIRDTSGDDRRLDALLDRIAREGLNSLSWRERRFLRRYRKR